MIRYYVQTQPVDRPVEYLSVDHSSARYYRGIGQPNMREARAAAIEGSASSVCTTSISTAWLREHCRPILKAEIPAKWLALL